MHSLREAYLWMHSLHKKVVDLLVDGAVYQERSIIFKPCSYVVERKMSRVREDKALQLSPLWLNWMYLVSVCISIINVCYVSGWTGIDLEDEPRYSWISIWTLLVHGLFCFPNWSQVAGKYQVLVNEINQTLPCVHHDFHGRTSTAVQRKNWVESRICNPVSSAGWKHLIEWSWIARLK